MIAALIRTASTIATRLFAIDPRSLAAARIVLGCVLALDLLHRLSDLGAFYVGQGALPLPLVRERFPEVWRWSLHWWSGSALFNGTLLAVAFGCSLALLVGAWTRVATIACWFLLVSLHHRLPLVNNAGDLLLALLLFWGMFLPWGRRWSIDAWRRDARMASQGSDRKVEDRNHPVASWATAAILLQVALMYGMSGYLKQHEAWRSGDALHYILAFDAYGRSAAPWLLQFPNLVTRLSLATLWLETVGPWLLFLPWFTGPIRLVLCCLFFVMHLGIAATLTVGWFSYVCMAGLLLFVPSGLWDFFARAIPDMAEDKVATDCVTADIGIREGSPARALTIFRFVAVRALAAVGLLLLLLVIIWNIDTARRFDRDRAMAPPKPLIPQWIANPMRALGLTQQWNMFSRPTYYDEWFTARGRLANGEMRDVWTGGTMRDPLQSPRDPSGMFANHRWRKLFHQLTLERNRALRASIGQWLVAQWNQSHGPDEQLVFFALDHTAERIQKGDELTRLVVTRWYAEGDDWLTPGFE